MCVVLNPNVTSQEKTTWQTLLTKWSQMDVCPLEDADTRAPTHANASKYKPYIMSTDPLAL